MKIYQGTSLVLEMDWFEQIIERIQPRLQGLSIFARLFIGNSIIIIIGAIGGTLVTRHLLVQAADLWLIILFSFIGILLSVVTNGLLIRNALSPLYQLRHTVERIDAGQIGIDKDLLEDTDPDIKKLAVAIQSMLNQLENRALQLRALSGRAINAQEEERKRIAREIHDDTGQALSMLIINLERLSNNLSPNANGVHEELEATRKLAIRTLENLRNAVHGLRPSILDDLGLIPAIRWYVQSNLDHSDVKIKVIDSLGDYSNLDAQQKIGLFRIAQEAINNVARHADAKVVTISLCRVENKVCLRVEDDGSGFNKQSIEDRALKDRRLGLLGIKERAELFGGKVNVDSAVGVGTVIEVHVPLNRDGESHDG